MYTLCRYLIIHSAITATARRQKLPTCKWSLVFLDKVEWVPLRIVLRATICLAFFIIVVSAAHWALIIKVCHDTRLHLVSILI